MKRQALMVLAASLLAPRVAFGHIGAETLLAEGLTHPLMGYDHLLAMIAIGVISAELGGAAIWRVPLAFVLGMACGAALGIAGFGLPMAEPAIALSVLLLGAAIALPAKLRWLSLLAAGAFGLLHGYGHGLESPPGGAASGYIAGFLLTTAALHAIGAFAALIVLREPHGERWLRRSGWGFAAAGAVLVVQASVGG